MLFSLNFPSYHLLNVPDYHQNINNFKRIIISPFQTSWNGDRWDNFSSCRQFHLLTLNFCPLHRTEHNSRQDPSEVESVLDRCDPKSGLTTQSWEAREAQQCNAPAELKSFNACVHQGCWEHRITGSLRVEKTPKSSNMQCSSGKLFTASSGILAYSLAEPRQEMPSMEDSQNIMISEKTYCRYN